MTVEYVVIRGFLIVRSSCDCFVCVFVSLVSSIMVRGYVLRVSFVLDSGI